MTEISSLVSLSFVNWLHLVATVAWIGGIFTNILILQPSAKESLEPPLIGRFMGSFIKRFRAMVYVSFAVLVVTGVVMMIFNRHYLSTFDLNNLWILFVVVKHILVLALIIIGIYILESLTPGIGRLAAKGPSPELAKLQKRQMSMGLATLVIGIVILLFTGITGAMSALP